MNKSNPLIITLFLISHLTFSSCSSDATVSENNSEEVVTSEEKEATIVSKDKTVKFLWRAEKYDETYKRNFESIFIDEEYCKTISNAEKAALGYVATFIGSECDWDGEYSDDRSNLKCMVLSALGLGYQCSDQHLGFLRKMFKNDSKVMKELTDDNCPTVPFTAISQETFDEITLTVKGDEIAVSFKANGINLQMGEGWSWTETDYFQFGDNGIKLVKKDQSKVERSHF